MLGGDIGKRIGGDRANRGPINQHRGYLVAGSRSDRKGLACAGVYRYGGGGGDRPVGPGSGRDGVGIQGK